MMKYEKRYHEEVYRFFYSEKYFYYRYTELGYSRNNVLLLSVLVIEGQCLQSLDF